jgi:hypothetical protein
VVIDTVNHSGSQSGETTYYSHSPGGYVDYCICQLTLMPTTPQVLECDENCVPPKTWTGTPQQGSYMPEFWAVDRLATSRRSTTVTDSPSLHRNRLWLGGGVLCTGPLLGRISNGI